MSNDAAAEKAGSAKNGYDVDTHRENDGRVETPPIATKPSASRKVTAEFRLELKRPIDHAVDLARHDEIILVQSLDLLGASVA